MSNVFTVVVLAYLHTVYGVRAGLCVSLGGAVLLAFCHKLQHTCACTHTHTHVNANICVRHCKENIRCF